MLRVFFNVTQRAVCGALLVLGLATCSRQSEKANPANDVATMIATVERAHADVCACSNVTCARAAHEAYRAWKRTPASLHRRELTPAQADHLGQLELDMQQCVANVQRPLTPGVPDAPVPGTPR